MKKDLGSVLGLYPTPLVVVLISRPITGRIVDRNGPNSIIYVAFIIFAIGLITLSLATDTINRL